MPTHLVRLLALALLTLTTAACATSGSYLVLGGSQAPQAALVQRMAGAESHTLEARAEFASAFRLYQRLTAPQAVELEKLSEAFEDSTEECKERAAEIVEHIQALREETDDLVKEWNSELERFSGDTLRRKSAAMLHETETRARRVLQALEHLQERMQPVLLKLEDYALFFHHNLNARAIATLEDTYKNFDAEFHAMDTEFEKAQAEIADFLRQYTEPVPASPAE